MSTPERPCEAVAALLAALALGATLDPDEQTLVLEHLTLCEPCRRRLDAYVAVAQRLPLAAPDAEPPPELRARILAAAARASAGPPAPARPPAEPPPAPAPRRWRRMLEPAVALALIAMIVLSIVQGLMIYSLQTSIEQQRAQSAANGRLVVAAFGNADAVESTLLPPDGEGYASARVFISPGEPAVALYARELPQLPPEQTYQLWIDHDGRTVDAGSFAASAEGRAWRALRPPEPLGTIERVFVTVEPAAGSPRPRGPEVLSGAAVPAIP